MRRGFLCAIALACMASSPVIVGTPAQGNYDLIVYQGITTEITGEGDSIAPLDDRIIENNQAGYKHRGITPTWRTLDGYFARLEKQGIGINLGTYVGATSMVLGDDDVQPTPAQLQRPNQLAQGMDYVIVNGTLVIADGKMTHALPGKVLRGPEYVAGN